MRATTRFLLLGAFAMCLSACLPEPPVGSEAAIFKRPSRYGWGASGRRPGSGAQPEQKKEQPRSNGNRFGHNDNNRDTNSSSQNSGSNSGSSDSGPNSNPDSGSGPGNTASNNRDTGNGAGEKEKKMTDSGSSSSNSGDSNSGSSNSGNSSSGGGAPPSNLNDYPYANLVPGKKGAVSLPGVGEIDVTGIKPGTPVEIDDPNNPGKKIYFRVP